MRMSCLAVGGGVSLRAEIVGRRPAQVVGHLPRRGVAHVRDHRQRPLGVLAKVVKSGVLGLAIARSMI
jgi:hypothetical protein